MKVRQVKAQKKEGAAAGFRAARWGQQSSSAAFNPIALLSRSTERDYPQEKLKVGSPGDIYEKEADQISEQVMNMPEPVAQRQPVEEEEPIQARPLAEQITPLVQKQPEEEEEPIQAWPLIQRQTEEEEEPLQEKSLLQRQSEEEEEPVQEKSLLQRQAEEEEEPLQTRRSEESIPSVSSNIQDRIQSLKGGGQPLSPSTRSFFEPRFGRDFSNVRVHANSSAAQTAKAVQAKAFTVGNDVVFGAGQYQLGTNMGRRLLAHELTHVLQQTNATNLGSLQSTSVSVQRVVSEEERRDAAQLVDELQIEVASIERMVEQHQESGNEEEELHYSLWVAAVEEMIIALSVLVKGQ